MSTQGLVFDLNETLFFGLRCIVFQSSGFNLVRKPRTTLLFKSLLVLPQMIHTSRPFTLTRSGPSRLGESERE